VSARGREGQPDHAIRHAFISYAREDSAHADLLQSRLEQAGLPVWRDTANLWPGEDWRAKIRQAIQNDALVFIACFSQRSTSRQVGYQYEELIWAIDELRRRRPYDPWLIPVRFDDCDIPDLDIGAGRSLRSIQRADLFGSDADASMTRLIISVRRIFGDGAGNTTQSTKLRRRRRSVRWLTGLIVISFVLVVVAVLDWHTHRSSAVGSGIPVIVHDSSGFRYVLTVSQGFTKAAQYAGDPNGGAPPGSWYIVGQVLIHNAQTDRSAPVPEAQVGNSQYFWLFLPGRHYSGMTPAGTCSDVSTVPKNGSPAFPAAGCVFWGLADEGSEGGPTYVGSTMDPGATLDFYFEFGPFRDPTILKAGQLYFWASDLPLTRLPLPK
jgi:hypothetical protein